jgi:hypothetical protein
VTHPLTRLVQDLYDLDRDLLPHEGVAMAADQRIRNDCAVTKGQAIQAWGETDAYWAVVSLANSKENAELSRALAVYEEAQEMLEYLAELGEVAVAMQTEAAE